MSKVKTVLSVVLTVLCVIICFLLQCCVFPNFSLKGIIPNLMLGITCVFGFMKGERVGMAIGFAGGLLCDIFFGSILGLNALLLTVIGFINGKFCGIFYPEDVKLPLTLISLSDFTYGILFYVFRFLIFGKLSIGYYFLHIMLPEMFYTLLSMVVVYFIILKVHQKFFAETDWSAGV